MKTIDSFVADRIAGISTSGIRRIFDLAATMKDPIDFSMGQPDFPVPDATKAAAHAAIDADQNGYTVTYGLVELRDKIKASLAREFDWDPTVFATCGVSGGLNLAMIAICNPGDEVLIPDPYFVSYPMHVELAGGRAVPVDLGQPIRVFADGLHRLVAEPGVDPGRQVGQPVGGEFDVEVAHGPGRVPAFGRGFGLGRAQLGQRSEYPRWIGRDLLQHLGPVEIA